MKNQDAPAGKGRFIGDAVFWLVALAILLYCLGMDHLRGSEERWAEISREMLITGDWFHPSINGSIYFDKPLLSYWPIVGLAMVLGYLDEFVIRLPSVIAGLIALWCTIRLGRRLFSEQTGRFAGWILLTSFGFISVSRTASADMMNMTAVIMAVLWFFYCKDKAGFAHYLVFYAICFGGALTKGLPALVIPPLLVFIYVIMDNSWKKHITTGHVLAFLIGCGLFSLSFYIAATTDLPDGFSSQAGGLTGLELVWRENVIRVFEPFDHVEPFYIYLVHMPRIMAPWAVLFYVAPLAMASRWKSLSLNARWLLVVNAVIFLMFSFSGSRRWYYIMPMVPFTAVMIGNYLGGDGEFPWRRGMAVFHKILLVVVCLVCVATLAAVPLIPRFESLRRLRDAVTLPGDILYAMPVAAVIAGAILLGTGALAGRAMALPGRWAAIILAAAVLLGAALSVVFPRIGALRHEKTFSFELKSMLKDVSPDDIVFFADINPKVVFYMDFPPPPTMLPTPERVKEHVANSARPTYVIAEDKWAFSARMAETFPGFAIGEPILSEAAQPFERPNRSKMRCWRFLPPSGK